MNTAQGIVTPASDWFFTRAWRMKEGWHFETKPVIGFLHDMNRDKDGNLSSYSLPILYDSGMDFFSDTSDWEPERPTVGSVLWTTLDPDPKSNSHEAIITYMELAMKEKGTW